ncbi:MAG: hypothetical protein JOY67_06555 [Hyphomicrobiales bacterium]|nr:hypothetical protein [Hyphomicrobiales bacterium]
MGKKSDDSDNGTDLGKLAKILGEIPTEQPELSEGVNKPAEISETPEQPKPPGDDEGVRSQA